METRLPETYTDGALRIQCATIADEDSNPHDCDCYSPEDLQAWRIDQWSYVGLVVTVEWKGVIVAQDALYGIEEGTLADGTVCDPYMHTDVAETALFSAEEWLDTLTDDSPAHEAIKRIRVHFGMCAPSTVDEVTPCHAGDA